jgi:hypothetical protein
LILQAKEKCGQTKEAVVRCAATNALVLDVSGGPISAPEERPSGMKPNLLPWLAKPSGSVCRGLLAVIVLIYTHRLILKPIMKQGVHAEAYI